MSEQKPAAWLHCDRPEADVVTDKVKHVWGEVAVGSLAAYSIPLYAIDIDAMVSRFLSWTLPKDFAPDGRVKFDRVFLVFDGFDGAKPIDISDAPDHYWPTGTNLFTAEQAKAMIEHILVGEHE